MPITERGRWTSTTLDERGRKVVGSLTEQGQVVFGITTGSTTHNAQATLQGTGSLVATATLYKLGTASLQATSSLTATAEKTLIASASLQGTSALTANASLTIMGSASLAGTSALTATGFIGGIVTGSASLIGTSSLTATAVSGPQLARLINLLGSKPDPIRLFGESIAPINLLGSSIDTIALQGSKPSIIALEGGIMATKTAQNFTIYAGDTPPFTITMADSTSLSGASIKWAVRKGHVKGAQVIYKDTDDGLTVSGYVVTILLERLDTSALEGKYYHEMELTDTSGNVSTIAVGEITILPSGV